MVVNSVVGLRQCRDVASETSLTAYFTRGHGWASGTPIPTTYIPRLDAGSVSTFDSGLRWLLTWPIDWPQVDNALFSAISLLGLSL